MIPQGVNSISNSRNVVSLIIEEFIKWRFSQENNQLLLHTKGLQKDLLGCKQRKPQVQIIGQQQQYENSGSQSIEDASGINIEVASILGNISRFMKIAGLVENGNND